MTSAPALERCTSCRVAHCIPFPGNNQFTTNRKARTPHRSSGLKYPGEETIKLTLLLSCRHPPAGDQGAQTGAKQYQRSWLWNFRSRLHGRRRCGRNSGRSCHGWLWTGRNVDRRRGLRIISIRTAENRTQNPARDNRRNQPPESRTGAAECRRGNRFNAIFVANNPWPITHNAAIRQADKLRRRWAFLRNPGLSAL